jgi:hypothetical protein
MNIQTMDEYIEIKDKSKASKEVKHNFQIQWIDLVKKEGLSEKTLVFLFDGFSFSGALPYIEYLASSEDKSAIHKLFLNCDRVLKNDSVSNKMLVHTLSLLCTRMPTENWLIANTLDSIVKSRGKNPFTDQKTFSKYFLDVFTASYDFSIFDKLDLSDYIKNSFKKKLELNVTEAGKTPKLSESESIIIKKLQTFISGSQNSEIKPEAKPIINNPPNQNEIQRKEEIIQNPIAKIVRKWEEHIKIAHSSVDALASEIKALKSDNEIILAEKSKLKAELDKAMLLYSDCKSDSEQKGQTISNIQEKNRSLEDKIAGLEKSLEEKEIELADRKTQNSLLLRNKDVQNDAAKGKLASELSVEYRDFLSAIDSPMTVELGENMKGQMTAIFNILKKYGVNL